MIAHLHIQTKLRDGCTHLQKMYYTPPFKVADVREDKKDKTLQLMLMSSSPGILDEDKYHIKIEVADGCDLKLHTQSYQRLFTMKNSAEQVFEVLMQNNSSFCYLPHPSVPHEGSDFTARNKIYMAGNCSLIWGEVLTCGRKLNGEVFLFSKYHNITEILLNNKLIIKENLLIEPRQINVNAIGQLEGYTHQASLVYLGENSSIKPLQEEINKLLALQQGITYGVTEAPKNGLIVRMMGQKGEQLYHCLLMIANYINSKQMAHAK